MARDVVDVDARGLEQKVPECCTEEIPLVGAAGFRAHWNRRDDLADRSGLHVSVVEHLLRRYGSRTHEVLERIRQDASLGQPLEGAPTYLAAEVHYAASHEGALHLDDVLTRRTRISIETFDRGVRAARPTARILSGILGWDDATIAREIEHYDARVRAERDSQTQPDDRTADAARLGAPDVRLGKQIQERAPIVSLEGHRRRE
jgi:glycerol-3-phosphate dehydrogenase